MANLEERGIPTVGVATTEFIQGAEAQAKSLGTDPALVFIPHPVQDRTDDELRQLADIPDWVCWAIILHIVACAHICVPIFSGAGKPVRCGITSRRGGKLYTVYLGGSTVSHALKSMKLSNGGMSKPELALTSFSWMSRWVRWTSRLFAAGMLFEKFQMPQ